MSVSRGALDTVKKLVIVLAAAVFLGAVAVGVLVVTGLVEEAPSVELVSVGIVVGPIPVVFLPVFLVGLVVGVIYVFFGGKLVEKGAQTKAQLAELPAVAKAILVGLPFGIVAWIAGVLTDVLATDLPPFTPDLLGLLVWVGISAFTYRHLAAERPLDRWIKMLVLSGVVATVLALAVVAIDLLFAIGLPGWLPLFVLLVAAPVLTAIVVRRIRSEEDGFLSTLLVKTGFAQLRQLQTVTVAISAGFLAGILAAVLVLVLIGGLLPPVVALVLVGIVASFGAAQFLDRTTDAREDLVIEEVVGRSSGKRRELAVRNDHDEPIDLRNAKIRDTEYNLYRTNIQVLLAPGETGRFDIPPEFALHPTEDDEVVLPLGFSISQRADSPVIVTRDGVKYRLRWEETVDETAGPSGGPAGDPAEE